MMCLNATCNTMQRRIEAMPVAELMSPQGHWISGRGLKTVNSNATIKPTVKCENPL